MLNVGVDAARDGLATLAESSWMLRLPRQDPHPGQHGGHPAGRARPGLPAPGDGCASGTVAVTFGKLADSAGSCTLLTVRWESAEPGDKFTVLLDADITLAPATGQACCTLTLAGVCRLPPATLVTDGYELARTQVIEAAREFIISVADTVTSTAAHGQEPSQGQAWSWLTGLPRTP